MTPPPSPDREQAREQIPFDVLFVGAGPASLAGAIHLARRVREWNESIKAGTAPAGSAAVSAEIAIIEKADAVGDHGISGAVLNPSVLRELLPDYKDRGFEGKPVEVDDMFVMTRGRAMRIPDFLRPPGTSNIGYYAISLGKFCAWLAGIAEAEGVTVLPGTTGVQVLTEGDTVVGVRTGDKGLAKDGSPKSSFTPGYDLQAKVTIFGEGPRGTLAEDLTHRFNLRGESSPQSYSLGVKEVIRVKAPADDLGFVWHTMGYPVPHYAFGGGFLYNLGGGLLSVGLVMGLDWKNPVLDAHRELQRFKSHPKVKALIAGGETVSYGAKTIPEGGYFSVPRLHMDGAIIVGDSAGFVRVKSLKGIHYAMKSGMLAADAAFEALERNNPSEEVLAGYRRALDASVVMKDLWADRYFRSSFTDGMVQGFVRWPMRTILGKAGLAGTDPRKQVEADWRQWRPKDRFKQRDPMDGIDPAVYVEKLTDVYKSGTKHREDQPSHIQVLSQDVCFRDCVPVYGVAPCASFCPAAVYEHRRDDTGERIQVNFANCVHCKTCGIVDPCDTTLGDGIQNIRWRVPNEGGPKYVGL